MKPKTILAAIAAAVLCITIPGYREVREVRIETLAYLFVYMALFYFVHRTVEECMAEHRRTYNEEELHELFTALSGIGQKVMP